MKLLIQNGRVIDPASGFDQTADLAIAAGRIVAIVNRYDNLCNPAGRTPPMTPHEAVAMLFAQGRTRLLGKFSEVEAVFALLNVNVLLL